METEIFTLCDFAQETAGKLTIVGTFDQIIVQSFPSVHPSCSLACRLRFAVKEAGMHSFTIRLTDADGKNVVDPIEGNMNVVVPPTAGYAALNMVVNLNQLQFEREGKHSFQLYIDGNWTTALPVNLVKAGGPVT